MKLIGNLKEQVAATTNKAEAKEVIAKAGMELTDEEMDMVSGGGELEDTRILLSSPASSGRSQLLDAINNIENASSGDQRSRP